MDLEAERWEKTPVCTCDGAKKTKQKNLVAVTIPCFSWFLVRSGFKSVDSTKNGLITFLTECVQTRFCQNLKYWPLLIKPTEAIIRKIFTLFNFCIIKLQLLKIIFCQSVIISQKATALYIFELLPHSSWSWLIRIFLSCGMQWSESAVSLFMDILISWRQNEHFWAMAHRASSSASCEWGSGRPQLDSSRLRMFCSQPSSLMMVAIQGCVFTQPPRACRLSLQSSHASSHHGAHKGETCTWPSPSTACSAPRRNRRAEEKNSCWLEFPRPVAYTHAQWSLFAA